VVKPSRQKRLIREGSLVSEARSQTQLKGGRIDENEGRKVLSTRPGRKGLKKGIPEWREYRTNLQLRETGYGERRSCSCWKGGGVSIICKFEGHTPRKRKKKKKTEKRRVIKKDDTGSEEPPSEKRGFFSWDRFKRE